MFTNNFYKIKNVKLNHFQKNKLIHIIIIIKNIVYIIINVLLLFSLML